MTPTTYIRKQRKAFVEELTGFLRIPSVSTAPAHKPDMRKTAAWLSAQMRSIGLEHARIMPTGGHPAVYADWLHAPGKPTVLIYGHYDVQPAEPLELWTSGPFEPTVRKNALYARGAVDDKGQVFMHLKALEAHLMTGGRLPVNVKLLIEGEEEIGSPHLGPFIRAHRTRLRTDAILVSDTSMIARGVPGITHGLRGLVYFQIDMEGSRGDLHSGSFGGAVVNPAFALARMIAALKDADGRVAIPGFYDDVRRLGPAERRALARLPFREKQFQREIGAPRLVGEQGFTTLERLWCRPTLEVNGLVSGFTGEGSKTVLPARAMAKISMRLVPDQDPARIAALFVRHIKKIAPPSVRTTVTTISGHGAPWLCPIDHPAIQAVARAIRKGFGKTAVFLRAGGSIPIVPILAETLKAPCLLFGIGLPDENSHAPDENLDLDNLHHGTLTVAHILDELAALPRG